MYSIVIVVGCVSVYFVFSVIIQNANQLYSALVNGCRLIISIFNLWCGFMGGCASLYCWG